MTRTQRISGNYTLMRGVTRRQATASSTSRPQFTNEMQTLLSSGRGKTRSAAAGSPAAPEALVVRQDSATGQNPAASAMTVLEAAMRRHGMNPGVYNLSYSEQVVTYPGGSYVNKLITADFGNGKSEQYMADLVLRNPDVAAVEMQRLTSSVA